MPLNFARRLTGPERSREANGRLGVMLAFIAGAANAGGYLAVHQYTSHLTGIVSSMADNLVAGDASLVLRGIGALVSFLLGAVMSSMMVNFARRRALSSAYALPLLVEGGLLLGFGFEGSALQRSEGLFVPGTVMLLCFIMGLQNAVISKISRSEIRTTHITGTVTDIGIELGRLFYVNRDSGFEKVVANRARLRLLCLLLGGFVVGAVSGAYGFRHVGYLCVIPLAVLLALPAAVPALDDVLGRRARANVPG